MPYPRPCASASASWPRRCTPPAYTSLVSARELPTARATENSSRPGTSLMNELPRRVRPVPLENSPVPPRRRERTSHPPLREPLSRPTRERAPTMSGTDLALWIVAILGVVAIVVSVCVLADRIHARNPKSKLTIGDTGRVISAILSVVIQAAIAILTRRP